MSWALNWYSATRRILEQSGPLFQYWLRNEDFGAKPPLSLDIIRQCRQNTPVVPQFNDVQLLGAFGGGLGLLDRLFRRMYLNQSKSGIYIDADAGLRSAANTVIPANAGIQGTVQNVLSWTPAYASVTKVFALSGCTI